MFIFLLIAVLAVGSAQAVSAPYLEKIGAGQAIYEGPGYDYRCIGMVSEDGTYTIKEEAWDQSGMLWGALQSGAGWINLTAVRAGEMAVMYLQIGPFLIYAMRRKLPDSEKAEEASAPEAAGKSDELNTDADPIATLTKREREVLELIGSGYSNGDIAKVLFISEHTVNDYTKKIYRKLDVHSRHAAAVIINQYKQ